MGEMIEFAVNGTTARGCRATPSSGSPTGLNPPCTHNVAATELAWARTIDLLSKVT